METMDDVLILGGGPAGCTAALYAARSALKTRILEKLAPGGQMATTDHIDNYPGFPEGIEGYALGSRMEQQAVQFGAQITVQSRRGFLGGKSKDGGNRRRNAAQSTDGHCRAGRFPP